MTDTLLLSYQIEYETTSISLEDLKEKYNLTDKDLKGSSTWVKSINDNNTIVPTNDTIVPNTNDNNPNTDTIVPNTNDKTIVPNTNTIVPTNNSNVEFDNSKFERDIQSFKEQALKYCKDFMALEAAHASTKEVKDIVAIIASIEPKQQAQSTTQVNVLVQNLAERFKDDV